MVAYPPWKIITTDGDVPQVVPAPHFWLWYTFPKVAHVLPIVDLERLALQFLMLAAVVAAVVLVFSGDWWRLGLPKRDRS